MQTTEKSTIVPWLATVWALLLVSGLIYYLWYAWSKREVIQIWRWGVEKISRDTRPFLYWAIYIFYILIASGLFLILGLRANNLLK